MDTYIPEQSTKKGNLFTNFLFIILQAALLAAQMLESASTMLNHSQRKLIMVKTHLRSQQKLTLLGAKELINIFHSSANLKEKSKFLLNEIPKMGNCKQLCQWNRQASGGRNSTGFKFD